MIERLLKNLALQRRLPDEIMVVDASPNDDTERRVIDCETHFPPGTVRYVRSAKGLARQREVGIGHTQVELIFMLDDDVLLENDCIQVLEAFIISEAGQPFSGVSTYITNDYDRQFTWVERFYHRVGIYGRLEPGRWLYNGAFLEISRLAPFSGVVDVDYLPGCSMMFRRKVIAEIRPEPAVFFDGEDKHWTLRISQQGHKLGILGDAKLVHDHVPGGARRSRFEHAIMNSRNHARRSGNVIQTQLAALRHPSGVSMAGYANIRMAGDVFLALGILQGLGRAVGRLGLEHRVPTTTLKP
jgi:GT2 family glycosyltransferase